MRHRINLSVLGAAAVMSMVAALSNSYSLAREDSDKRAKVQIGHATVQFGPPPWESLHLHVADSGQTRLNWHGTWAGSVVDATLVVVSRDLYGVDDPEDLAAFGSGEWYQRDPGFNWAASHLIHGAFGYLPLANLRTGVVAGSRDEHAIEVMVLGGILQEHGYRFSISAQPPLPTRERNAALAFMRKGLRVETPRRMDPAWTEHDAARYLRKYIPDDASRVGMRVLRTAHYILFISAGTGADLGKKLEQHYAYIKSVLKFREAPERPLMPVFVFATASEYGRFCEHVLKWKKRPVAHLPRGHAWRDYYATYSASPEDSVHLHEATHQIVANRMFLTGGGSWFQEGLAEFMSSSTADRKLAATRAIERGVSLQSLFLSARLVGVDAYRHAASVIDFLRLRRPTEFPTFVRSMGRVRQGHMHAVESVLRDMYGLSTAQLQSAWAKHWGADETKR